MDLEKAIFLISLTRDGDFPLNIEYRDIIDFYNEDGKDNLIIKKKDDLESEIRIIKYTIEKDNNLVGITKEVNDNYVFYGLVFKNIVNRYFARLLVNFKNTITYEFDKDVLSTDVVDNVNILHVNMLSDSVKNSKARR